MGTTRLALAHLRVHGWRSAAHAARNVLAFRVLGATTDLTQHRYRLSQSLARQLDSTVARGPFAGTVLSDESWWSAADRGSMLLGLYEAQVLSWLQANAPGRRALVDIGAADGYYAIGALVAGWVEHAYCFEISDEGRRVIASNARRNGVSERVTILGEATPGFIGQLRAAGAPEPSTWCVICDIEGGEFSLLDDATAADLTGACGIVELHADATADPRVRALVSRLAATHEVELLPSGPRDPASIPELEGWCDDDRWLLCSESRAATMHWLAFRPRR